MGAVLERCCNRRCDHMRGGNSAAWASLGTRWPYWSSVPARTAPDGHQPTLGGQVDAIEPGQVDQKPPVDRAVARDAVPPALDANLVAIALRERQHPSVVPSIDGPDHERRLRAVQTVVSRGGGAVAGITRHDDRTDDPLGPVDTGHCTPATPTRLPSGSVKWPMTSSPGVPSGPNSRVPPRRSAS
jgi:hypothetical protein